MKYDIYKQEKLIRKILIQTILALPQSSLKQEYRNKNEIFWKKQIKITESINLDYITIEKSNLEKLRGVLVLLIDLDPKTQLSL